MSEVKKDGKEYVFGLDIGTRSVVGSVGYLERNKFQVVAHYVKEHETRAMMDGQIHDIQKVGETIGYVKYELEKQLGSPLKEVCIAAAGRELETRTVHVEQERNEEQAVTREDIYSLESLGVEKAYDGIREDHSEKSFYCVGYTVVKYYVNDYTVNNLEGHKGKKVGADVLATFLPNDVVDGLYAAVDAANLEVGSLTLEPIAAMNVAIPEQFRLLNIALVDVGAGTSDICITKDESIIAYGMIPRAGDELTKSIVQKCLVEFNVAEQIKREAQEKEEVSYQDIIGLPQTISSGDVKAAYEPVLESITKEIADKIKKLNGGKSVSAVFVVGGGGKVEGFTKHLAKYLKIPEQRVVMRGKEVMGDINFLMDGVEKDPTLVTPIGICLNYYNQKNNFIFVNVNDIRMKLYDNDQLTVVDAALQMGFPNEDLFPKRGRELMFTLNGTTKMLRGEAGEPAIITINGKEADLHSKISANDRIYIKASTAGEPAVCNVEYLREYKEKLHFTVEGNRIECPKFVTANGEHVLGSYQIKEHDIISIPQYYSVEELMEFMDLDITMKIIKINGRVAHPEDPVYENFEITLEDRDWNRIDENQPEEEQEKAESMPMEMQPVFSEKPTEEEKEEEAEEKEIIEIHVTVNQTAVTLSGKSEYTFVDVFNVYPFDTNTVKGDELVTTINGKNCMFLDPLAEGDALEIFWRNYEQRD